MKVYTSEPLLTDQAKIVKTIARFWDKISYPFHEAWGPHIHHGYFEDNANPTPIEAQELLLDKLAACMEIGENQRILDVGCGMGATSIFLAQRFKARVSGVTLSSNQVAIARQKAADLGVTQVDFKIEDAHSLASFPDKTFDVVWSLESCEQFYNKPLFLSQAYRVLKPGGKLLLATWCSSQDEYIGNAAREYSKICQAMDVPYMPTISYYAQSLTDAGFKVIKQEDWAERVEKTWSIGVKAAQKKILVYLFKAGIRGVQFVLQGKLMERGFAEKMVRYGVLIGEKP